MNATNTADLNLSEKIDLALAPFVEGGTIPGVVAMVANRDGTLCGNSLRLRQSRSTRADEVGLTILGGVTDEADHGNGTDDARRRKATDAR